jgi:hypothetical protein
VIGAAEDRAGTYPQLRRRKAEAIEQDLHFLTVPFAG